MPVAGILYAFLPFGNVAVNICFAVIRSQLFNVFASLVSDFRSLVLGLQR
jgi:hypothetical protein